MESILKGITRPYCVQYEGKEYSTLATIPEGAHVKVSIPKAQVAKVSEPSLAVHLTGNQLQLNRSYVIRVRSYMTRPATPEFGFMVQWNNDVPMPFRVMCGEVIRETRGMVMMDLHCEPLKTSVCMRCGKTLTHPVSMLYGLGPECGSHAYLNPFETEEQLREAFAEVRGQLANIKWRGWIIKSAIEMAKEVKKEVEDYGMG